MKPDDSRYPDDWYRIGQKELKRAEILLDAGDLEGAGFNIQQAVEKYMKGYLLSKGWNLRKIHDLETLLNDSIKYKPLLEKYRESIQRITEYYIIERYPLMVSSQLTKEEIITSLKKAVELIDTIKTPG